MKELKEMKKGASIAITNSFEKNQKKKRATKFKKTKDLKKMKEGVLIAIANNYECV